MKKILAILFILTVAFSNAQNSDAKKIIRRWGGAIEVQGFKLEVYLKITSRDNALLASIDVPIQGNFDLPADSVSFRNDSLWINFTAPVARYKGVYSKDSAYIEGNWYQGGQSIELNFSPATETAGRLPKPQEPSKPYPYIEEEITFENKKAKIKFGGTLTLPGKEKNYPAVVLISGSGAQNRNSELMGHKPFLVIADHLTRNGIAVLRFDERGVGASGGSFKNATSADFASDVISAVEYLKSRKEINKKQLGLIGHSEGGVIAPMIAAEKKDIAFIVMLAAPGLKGSDLLLLQNTAIGEGYGMTDVELAQAREENKKCYDIVCSDLPDSTQRRQLRNLFSEDEEDVDIVAINREIDRILSPWMKYYLRYNPQPSLEKVKCPVLVLNGDKDLQVPAKENLTEIENALKKGGNTKYTVKTLPGLNHLFQKADSGLPDEYATIPETFSPDALKMISDWIIEQTKQK